MDMYDEVTVKYPLPDPSLQDMVFQTKCLERYFQEYIITKEGRLVLLQYKRVKVPRSE